MVPHATVDRVLQSVAPSVRVDREVLDTLLTERPGPDAVIALLSVPSVAVVRAAVVYLGVFGTFRDSPLLVLCLQHRDDGVAQLAEKVLWSIWMQAGSARANQVLAAAIRDMEAGNPTAAAAELAELIASEPRFAEAHFQHGLALGTLDQPQPAATSQREALRINPYHFGAAAALGHACLELGDTAEALRQYRRALQIHPRLDDIRAALREVSALIGNTN